MLVRKDQPATVESASVIYKLVVYCPKHVYINLGQVEPLQEHPSFICFIKIRTFTGRNRVPATSFFVLSLLISEITILPLKVNARNGYLTAIYL